ncbi:sugar kinase [Amaricoccus tamworthensis]|uniref:sugar kinase n=1 Tax=Amaricoccus tamworthensis TaxID=57002 RepID=UPI003C7ABA05
MRIACAGEAMVELSLDGDSATMGFAGDVLNTAIYLRRNLPPDHDVSFVSLVGDDVLSDRLRDFVASEGIDVSGMTRLEGLLTGLYAINTDENGERSFLYWRENSAARRLFQRDGFEALEGAGVVYLSAITLAVISPEARESLFSWLSDYRSRGGLFAFDSNYRPRLWSDVSTARAVVERAWRMSDIALPSVDDEMALFGDDDEQGVIERFRSWNVGKGSLKRGATGPLSIREEDAVEQTFEPAERVVDTTAAGDSFNGGFLAEYIKSGSLADAMMAGHRCASHVVGFRGAIVPKSA